MKSPSPMPTNQSPSAATPLEALTPLNPSPSTDSPSPPPLPVELLEDIVSQLGTQELGRFLQASRQFYLLTAPSLYTWVTIDLDEPSQPLSSDCRDIAHSSLEQKVESQVQSKMRRKVSAHYADYRLEIEELHSQRSRKIIITSSNENPLPDRFLYTTHLTLTSHTEQQCTNLPPIHMPNLEVLRIRPAVGVSKLNICNHPSSQPDGLSKYACPLLAHLHPRELMLGDITTSLDGDASGLWRLPKRVTVFVGICTGNGHDGRHLAERECYACEQPLHSPDKKTFLSELPDAVKTLTLIMGTWSETWSGIYTGEDAQVLDLPRIINRARDDDFFRDMKSNIISCADREKAISVACIGLVSEIEIVGLETFGDFEYTPEPINFREGKEINGRLFFTPSVNDIRKGIANGLDKWLWSGKEALARSEAVVFTTGKDYSRREEGYNCERRRACEGAKWAIRSDILFALDKYPTNE